MSSLAAAAIVISRGNPGALAKTLEAIERQHHALSQVLVVETAQDSDCIELAKSFGFGAVAAEIKQDGEAVNVGIQALQGDPSWLWVLDHESQPAPDALFHLAKAAEISPSVGIIGPKLLDVEQPLLIRQFGLTVTATSRPLALASGAYDQGQFDSSGDTLAVSLSGMLVMHALWKKLDGFHSKTPLLARDIEFCIKARALGFRVVVEPKARLFSRGPGSKGGRLNRALDMSRAHVHLATILWPAGLVPILYLLMPLAVLSLIPVNIVQKNPARILGQLIAWLYSWFTFPQRLAARSHVRKLGSIAALGQLYASREAIRLDRERHYEEVPAREGSPGLFASGAVWLAFLPLAFGFASWPQGAIYSESLLPLGPSFKDVWTTLSGGQLQYLDGVELPADPFVWFFALLAWISPGSASIGLATFIFIAPALGFLGAWLVASTLLKQTWLKTGVALSYSLSAPILLLQKDAAVVELAAVVLFPWASYFLSKAAFAFSLPRAWRWLGLAGLAGAGLGASSPILFVLLVIAGLYLAVIRPRRAGVLIWFAIPGVTLLTPWIEHAFSTGNIVYLSSSSVVAKPPLELYEVPVWWVTLGVFGAVALFSLVRLQISLPLWAAAIILLFSASYQPLASSEPLLLALMLVLLLLMGIGAESFNSQVPTRAVSATLLIGSLITGAVFGALAPRQYEFGPERLMPALVAANAAADPSIRTLKINLTQSEISAELVWRDGLFLQEQSLLYELQRPETEFDAVVAQFAGSLLAGNPEGVEQLNRLLGVDFVLLSGTGPQLIDAKVAIDGLVEFQPAGQTLFGQLWSTAAPNSIPSSNEVENANFNVQLIVLGVFALLAIPTPAAIRGRRLIRGLS